MATSSTRFPVHPLEYAVGTVVFTFVASVLVGISTLGVYELVRPTVESTLQFFVLSVLGLGLLLSQDVVFGEDGDRTDDTGSLHRSAMLAVAGIAVYNVLVFVAVVAASTTVALGAEQWAFLIAYTYPAYDLLTGAKGNPASVTGLLVRIARVLNRFGWLETTGSELLRSVELGPIRFMDRLRQRSPG